jgi:hypothetical protein
MGAGKGIIERIVLVKNKYRSIKARILRTGCNGY